MRLAAVAAVVAFAGCGGPADHSARIADAIAAKSCTATDYEISNKLDGSKERIYDCVQFGGTRRCVTESGGIVSDATATVRLLFSDTLSGGRPGCAA